jgi:hypothetical protein
MGEISTIGLDIAKSVFQVHGVDADGAVVIRKRVSRASWALRRVRPGIIGAAGFRRSVTR